MRAAHVLEIQTPKGVLLNGLWFGPTKAKTVYVWLHGLSSTVFSKHDIATLLTDRNSAVLMFNNRGHDQVSKVRTVTGKRIRGGSAHEKFTDCVDDIDGAIAYAKKAGAKQIFLVGHSTGCQKAAYWASRRKIGVRGIVLLAPISDYAATVMIDGQKTIDRAMKVARSLVRAKRSHELLPESVWSHALLADAQRFISLYSGAGPEEQFPYWQSHRRAVGLSRVKIPMLAVLAQNDEYADRPAEELYGWFLERIYEGEVHIVPKADHGFRGEEQKVAQLIRSWSSLSS